MKNILKLTGLIAAFLICGYSYGQQITNAEYFLDAQCGARGGGIAIVTTQMHTVRADLERQCKVIVDDQRRAFGAANAQQLGRLRATQWRGRDFVSVLHEFDAAF